MNGCRCIGGDIEIIAKRSTQCFLVTGLDLDGVDHGRPKALLLHLEDPGKRLGFSFEAGQCSLGVFHWSTGHRLCVLQAASCGFCLDQELLGCFGITLRGLNRGASL